MNFIRCFHLQANAKKNSNESFYFLFSIVRQEQRIMLFEVLVRLKSEIAVIIFMKTPQLPGIVIPPTI